ncbi:MAG: azurin, partial [Planctomycetaceae bacterium]|nr:azurin [Planctomycetaceae bacterium]
MKLLLPVALLFAVFLNTDSIQGAELELKPHDKIVLIGNTFVERMQHANHFETLLHARFPKHELVVRNLGWSADELKLRPRSKDFNDHGHTLADHKPDVIIACFGFNESFAGPDGLEKYKNDLRSELKTWTTTKYNGKQPPRILIVSPIANENLPHRKMLIGTLNNKNLELYTNATKEVAKELKVGFLDIFRPSLRMMNAKQSAMTFNGVHLTDDGYKRLAPIMMDRIFGKTNKKSKINMKRLRAEVAEKSLQHWYDYRAVNGYYIYGGRKEPFGVNNFPAEFAKLRKMVANRDRQVWAVAQGKNVPKTIDDSNTGDFADIKTNITFDIKMSSAEEAKKAFKLPEGYEINLFASEQEFPELENPCKMTFDGKGRLWVCTMSTYPMYLPGQPVHDKILIFEDT